jgi:acetyl-CoA acetyltransferase
VPADYLMSDAFILSACRTPIGKFRRSLASVSVTELGALAVREAVARAGCEPSDLDEVIMGNVLSAGVGQRFERVCHQRLRRSPSTKYAGRD